MTMCFLLYRTLLPIMLQLRQRFACPPQAFFAQIYSEAQSSQAAEGHHALAAINHMQRMQRHYTMNIDGLAEV